MADTTGGAPADWYPDPNGRPVLRWWNGTEWTREEQPTPTLHERRMLAAIQDQARHAATTSSTLILMLLIQLGGGIAIAAVLLSRH